MNYYNEFDPKAAAWIRELIAASHIPPGEVDTRSITEIKPDELRGFTQCHFFAGIAGWPLALALAEVDPARPLWAGFPLVAGQPGRVMLLRGYGNAIVPPLAAEFIKAALQAVSPAPHGQLSNP